MCSLVFVCICVLSLAISRLSSLSHYVLITAENSNCDDFSILNTMILLTQPPSTLFGLHVILSHIRGFSQLVTAKNFSLELILIQIFPVLLLYSWPFLNLNTRFFFLITFYLVFHTMFTLHCSLLSLLSFTGTLLTNWGCGFHVCPPQSFVPLWYKVGPVTNPWLRSDHTHWIPLSCPRAHTSKTFQDSIYPAL